MWKKKERIKANSRCLPVYEKKVVFYFTAGFPLPSLFSFPFVPPTDFFFNALPPPLRISEWAHFGKLTCRCVCTVVAFAGALFALFRVCSKQQPRSCFPNAETIENFGGGHLFSHSGSRNMEKQTVSSIFCNALRAGFSVSPMGCSRNHKEKRKEYFMALAATMRKKSSSCGLAQTGGDRIGGSPALEEEGEEEDILPPLFPDWFWRGDGRSPILSLPFLYVCSDVGATVLVLLRQKHAKLFSRRHCFCSRPEEGGKNSLKRTSLGLPPKKLFSPS